VRQGCRGLRRREEGEGDGTLAQEAKTAGAWVKKGTKSHSSQGQIKNHLNTIFAQLLKIDIFSFMTMFI
jgi:hypothetical protein